MACATAIRAGGALYILAEAAGLEDAYYGADAGIQAGMIALTRRRELKHDIIRSAIDDCSSLSTRYPDTKAAAAFFGAGIQRPLSIRQIRRIALPNTTHTQTNEPPEQPTQQISNALSEPF